jgi:serine protease Do
MPEKSKTIKTIKKVLPAVVSITVSKYLDIPKKSFKEDYFGQNPFGQNPFDLNGFPGEPKEKKKVKIGGGSGFIANKSGIIITNRHVVIDPEAEYSVILNDGKKYKAEILTRNPINDIAIIKIEEKNLPFVELGDSSNLELGQTTIAIGNTLGIFRNTVSIGVVSGLSRNIQAIDAIEQSTQNLKGLIQTDAAINPGNSGGPLSDIEGKIIGINCAMVFGAENVGFAIPINTAKKDLEELKKYGKIRQPFIGLRYVPVNKKLQEECSLPVNYGALVISEGFPGGEAITKGSPAEKAGIRELDIVLEIQNKKINIKNSLQDILQEFKVGDKIQLKVLRQGKEIILPTILTDRF